MASSDTTSQVTPPPFNSEKPAPNGLDNMKNKDGHPLGRLTTDIEATANEEIHGGMFGGENGGENYRTMGRWSTLFAMVTNQLGLGFLSLPSAVMTLGVVPGVIAIIGFGTITWYTGYEVYEFLCKYPHVVNIVDMVGVIGGRTGTIIAGVFLLIQLIMVSASAAITLSIAFNTLSGHVMCTVGFVGIACISCCVLCIPRSMQFVAKSGVPCFISILTAGLIVMISLGISNPARAPDIGWTAEIKIFGTPNFRETFNSCLRVVYAFAGNIVYATYMAEMRDPVRDFPFALRGLLFVSLGVYLTFAIGVYCLAGEYTSSPALGSAPTIPAKVAYGIILPAIFTTGLANGHIGTKYIYVQVMRWIRATGEITKNNFKSWATWIICVVCYWILCFIISNAIPIFDSILSIASATTIGW